MSTLNVYPNTSNIEFIRSRRGGVSALYDGRRYSRKKIYVNKNSFWKCNLTKGCRGNITLNTRNEIIMQRAHETDCRRNFAKTTFLKKLDDLKRVSSCNFESIPKQYDNMVRDLKNDGYNFVGDIPKFSSVKSDLYNGRNKVVGTTKMRFSNATDVEIPMKYQHIYLCEYEDGDFRIIVFCIRDVTTKMSNFNHFFADGTFRSCPKAFKQLYTIHGYDEINNIITPLFFALLPDKRNNTYKILFSIIKSQIPTWSPKKITLDFEIAAINAFKDIFPGILFKGCYYHFNHALWKKAKALQIKTRVKKRHVARCIGIARLPKKYLREGYDYVMAKRPVGEEINMFNKYFQKQWVNKDFFAESCCCETEKFRTNNNIEGWHRKINSFIGKKNPTLAHLLDVLESEATYYDLKKITPKKKKEYEEIDEEIGLAIKTLNENKISVGHCLEIISPFVIPF